MKQKAIASALFFGVALLSVIVAFLPLQLPQAPRTKEA
jgi:hypothetical protein